MNKADIIVRFTKEGFHCWPGAPERRAYLREKHRHLFYVEVVTTVAHDDREVEFHDLLDDSQSLFPSGDFVARSCEMLARDLGSALVRKYKRDFTVSVFEDNEVGARVVVQK